MGIPSCNRGKVEKSKGINVRYKRTLPFHLYTVPLLDRVYGLHFVKVYLMVFDYFNR